VPAPEAPSRTPLVRSSDPEVLQTLASKRTQQERKCRLELYQQMIELIARGKSQAEAATSVGLSLRTVQRWSNRIPLPLQPLADSSKGELHT
jgi:DNA invertase Pin-like site-specific DNA recombinase